jgi:hypothetical protein
MGNVTIRHVKIAQTGNARSAMSSRDTAARRAVTRQAAATPKARDTAVGWCVVGAVVGSLLIMIAADLLRRSWQPQVLILPAAGPPWQLSLRVSSHLLVVALWLGGLLGAAGLVLGLVALRRGLRLPLRPLVVAGLTGAAVLVLLPPVGSTDALDYAVYGHIAVLGHSPYVMTPLQYRHLTHLRYSAPLDYARDPSYYGPLATGEQFVAAKLAGSSLARTVLWLKVFNAIAFAAVAFAADRRFRTDPAGRQRAHLLWTANSLLIWSAIAAGHLDVLAAAVGVAGLLIADRRAADDRGWTWAVAAGACVGAATDIKVDYALFVLALCCGLRRRPARLLAAVSAAVAVLVISYAIVGTAALRALSWRVSAGSGWEYYGPIFHHLGISLVYAVPVAVCLTVPLAVLALARMPSGPTVPSAVRAALALSLAWLLLWPHQYAWYSVMIICVLIFYPATRIDWVAVAVVAAGGIASMPGLQLSAHRVLGHTLERIDYQNLVHIAPLVLLAAATAFVFLCVSQRWHGLARALTARGAGRHRSSLVLAGSW